ncbi:hypothetical protein [Stappia sp.]|uniref:hypothetical protein n=1 Tax=Stappia sp. TaxID=1870903 RepID=UPI003A99DB1F
MIADVLLPEPERALPPETHAGRPAFLDRLRQHFDRSDLDDATLEDAVGEAVGRLCDGERDAVLERLYSGRASADLLQSLISSLCLPAPRAPLAMPVQTLERDSAGASLRSRFLAPRFQVPRFQAPRLQALRVFSRRHRIGEG